MLLPIRKYGDPSLKSVSEMVHLFDAELETIAQNMVETMYAASGIGLAAPQVGLNIRLTTIDVSHGKKGARLITICNPEIVYAEGQQAEDEGCLSIPEFTATVVRPQRIAVRGQDIHGEEIRLEGEGLLARCLSHEIDHLDGILFLDHLSALKRTLIKNKIKRLAKSGQW